ncbi:TniB family NTP-binding protein [Dyella acidiphila]|uniref:TniB family NTP-binding protein n=1 Tax=Dyella acidiphila TaxID=2775866 RepID=A0ABR9GG44_9GAMM|nr:TniB family NTP-binding protein [Dyella acidiphila]MBE1162996.1 TniB family NTP-binding protein [Dyella acidiphila]
MLLTGNPGSGKSTFGEELARTYEDKVVIVSAEGSRTMREFYGRVLDSLGGPAAHPSTTSDREMAVLRAIKSLGIKALVVDEIQDLSKGTDRELNRVLAGIKFLTNRARLPLICLGALDSSNAFRTDKHLAQRLRPFKLPEWKVDQAFADFVGNIEAILPLRRPSSLRNAEALTFLIKCSGGGLRAIMERIALAAAHAILSGEESLTLKTLEEAEFAPSVELQKKLKYA